MNPARRAIAAEIHAAATKHDRGEADRLKRFRLLEPDSAELLALIVRAARPRRLLELGTSIGYSTMWLADAAEAIGGELVSVEVDPVRSARAGENLARAGLAAELRVQDAADTLRGSEDEAWDFVFLDAERPAYAGYWPELLRALAPGGLLAIDNVSSHAEQVADVTALIEAEPAVTTALVPTGAGVRLVVKT